MGKVLSWLLLLAVGYLVYKFLVISRRKAERVRQGPADAAGAPPGAGTGAGTGAAPGEDGAAGEPMLRCGRCGVYVPASEALIAGDKHYCSAEHRDADRGG